jgi:hypothetical protein
VTCRTPDCDARAVVAFSDRFCQRCSDRLATVRASLGYQGKRIRREGLAPAGKTADPKRSDDRDRQCELACGRKARPRRMRCDPCMRAGRIVPCCLRSGCDSPRRAGGYCYRHRVFANTTFAPTA